MEGLFPGGKKKIPIRLLGGALASLIVFGFGGCALTNFVKDRMPFKRSPTERARAIAEKHRFQVQSEGVHDQRLISVIYDAEVNKCVIIWE